jgi:hypothetical protein
MRLMRLMRRIGPIGPRRLHRAAAGAGRRCGVSRHGVAAGIVGIVGIGWPAEGRGPLEPFGPDKRAVHQVFAQVHPEVVLRKLLELLLAVGVEDLRDVHRGFHVWIVRIQPDERRLLVAVAVIGQVDVRQALRGEARALAVHVLLDLLEEDEGRQPAAVAGAFAVGAVNEFLEEPAVGAGAGAEVGDRPAEVGGGRGPGVPLGAIGREVLEEGLLLGGGGDGIGRPRAGRRFLPGGVEVIGADHGKRSPGGFGIPARSGSVYT